MDIFSRILEVMNVLNLTQTELMRELELSHTVIINWRKGAKIAPTILRLIELKYNINPDWLRHGDGDMFLKSNAESALSVDEQELIACYKQLFPEIKAQLLSYAKERLLLKNVTSTTNKAKVSNNKGGINIGNQQGNIINIDKDYRK